MPDTPASAPFADIAGAAISRLAEAREAWIDYVRANSTAAHWAAIARIETALGITDEEIEG